MISADLALYGDFGELLTTRKPATSPTDTVTGFTGKIETVGLVEFAARTYDPATRQWVQDDRYRGTVTRASSMNRYAYVEGAPESFVDELGFYRARAAIRAQALAAAEAAYQSALAAYEKAVQIAYKEAVSYQQTCGKYGCVKADMEVRGKYGFVNTADAVYGQYGYTSAWSIAAQKELETQERLDRDRAKIEAGAPSDWWLTKAVSGVGNFFVDVGDRGSTLVQSSLQTTWRRVTDPVQTAYDFVNGNILAEDTMALLQIVGADAELYNEGDYCGTAGICLTSNWTPVAHDSDGVAQRQAIAIGHVVTFPSGEPITQWWVEHEFTHVLQYEAMGAIAFGIDYGLEQFWGVVVQRETKEVAYTNQTSEKMANTVADDPNLEPGKNPLGHWFETKDSNE